MAEPRQLSEVIAGAMLAVKHHDDQKLANEHARRAENRRRQECERRILPYDGCITRDDARRIVDGTLDSEAWHTVEAWLRSDARFLLLLGDEGTGKTCAALRALGVLGGRFVSAVELERVTRSEHEEARAIREQLERASFLVIDELGFEPEGQSSAIALHQIVNKRQQTERTLITTNLSRADVERRYDRRTIARLEHQGVWVALVAKSYRGRVSAR